MLSAMMRTCNQGARIGALGDHEQPRPHTPNCKSEMRRSTTWSVLNLPFQKQTDTSLQGLREVPSVRHCVQRHRVDDVTRKRVDHDDEGAAEVDDAI